MLILLDLIKKHWKIAAVALSLIIAFGLGWSSHKPQVITKTETVTVQAEAKTVYVDRVITIEKKADGSTTEVITDHSKTTDDTNSSTKTDTSVVPANLSKYRLGVQLESPISLTPVLQYRAVAGMRIVGPFWLDAGYSVSTHTAGLGFSWEF